MVNLERLRGAEQEIFFAPLSEMKQEPKKEITDRKAYFKEYNDRMKEKRKLTRLEKKNEQEKEAGEATSKYYGAEAFKVLMSFKDYTELNKEKKQLWLDLNWTLQDCQKSFSEGYANVVAIMKLGEVASRLTRDYWETAKSEERKKSKSWNVLSEEEKSRLIKYWGRQKANIENGYIDEDERLERKGNDYLKEIERAKHHEERGKIKCPCGWCEQEQIFKSEAKAKIKKDQEQAEKELDEIWGVNDTDNEKGKCENCYKVKKLNSESGLCKTCSDYYNN